MHFDGDLVGFVIIYFDYAIIRNIFSNNLPPNSIFEVHDRFGNIIFSNIDTETAASRNKQYSYVQSNFYAETAGWYFDMAIPTSEIRGRINSTLWRALLIVFIIALTAIISGVLAVYRMTRNLEKLNAAMLQVSHGNLDSQAGFEGRDEIGKMGKIFDKMVSDIKRLLEQISEEEKQKRKTEIDFLQAQINPHFVSNALNTIAWMAKMHNAENIAALAKSLTALMQSSMRRGSRFIQINDEIEHTMNYVEIQKYSAFYDFDIDLKVKEEVKAFYTPRFILQPLVENAIIHGLPENTDNQKIEISIFREGDLVHIEVFDNGKGIKQDQIENIIVGKNISKNRYSRIGIKNIQERIKLFFGDNYGLSFESTENEYTKAIIVIPIITISDLENADEYG
jgi:sensor histidine kinase YesM